MDFGGVGKNRCLPEVMNSYKFELTIETQSYTDQEYYNPLQLSNLAIDRLLALGHVFSSLPNYGDQDREFSFVKFKTV